MNIFKKFQSKNKIYCFDLYTAPFCKNRHGRYVSYTTSSYIVSTDNNKKMKDVSLALKKLFKKRRIITLIVIYIYDPSPHGIFYRKIAKLEWANIRSMRSLSKALDTLMANAILKEV
jgi:hypothetical protein